VVADCRYHGHDTVLRCTLDGPDRDPAGERLEITARLSDGAAWPTGSRVGLRARGPVTAWPAPAAATT
jgi:hypothetical protein